MDHRRRVENQREGSSVWSQIWAVPRVVKFVRECQSHFRHFKEYQASQFAGRADFAGGEDGLPTSQKPPGLRAVALLEGGTRRFPGWPTTAPLARRPVRGIFQ